MMMKCDSNLELNEVYFFVSVRRLCRRTALSRSIVIARGIKIKNNKNDVVQKP